MKRTRTLKSHLFGMTFLGMALSAAGFQGNNIMAIFTDPGLPPQPGEQIAKDYKIQFPGHTYEIDGVCKVNADEGICWKPDGSPNPELTRSVSSAIANMANYRTWTVTVGKKRRIVFIKDTRQQNAGNDHGYGQVFRANQYSNGFTEGWTDSGGAFGNASSSGFDGSYTNWSTVEGVFSKSTKEFPLRYLFQDSRSDTQNRPLKKEKIEISGNVFEITAIEDYVKPKNNPQPPYYYTYGNQKAPVTNIKIRIVSMKNPFASVTLQLGNDAGRIYEYVDAKGNLVTQQTVQKWYQDHPNNVPRKQAPFPYYAGGSANIDPMYMKEGSEFSLMSYVPKDKCKTLVTTTTKREMYVFDRVALDPK